MRLATILPENSDTPVAAVSVDAQDWIGLYPFLAFFGVKNLPAHSGAPLADFLPLLMPRFSELTRKVSDWPEHGRIFQKRGGKTLRLPLEDIDAPVTESAFDPDLIALDAALEKLAEIDPRRGRVVELRFFGGLSVEETARVLQVSPDTVVRDWRVAKAWLFRYLNHAD